MLGTITTIQRLSIHDGPGIRSTVFLKGCNMRCRWCHNPETWTAAPILQQLKDKCICCAHCLENCPAGALSIREDEITIDRNLCTNCGGCADACVSRALTVIGERVSPEELLKRVLRDKISYDNSGGGVTLSGGEPTLQKDFCIEFLKLCRAERIHTAIESNLSCPETTVEELLPYVDLWMCDLKIADPQKHALYTGVSNVRTVDNLKLLSSRKVNLVVRTPVIPGVNDSEQDISEICELLNGLNISYYELLPFHTMGFYKFPTLGMENPLPLTSDLKKDKLEPYNDIIKYHGIITRTDE